jgi:hypothetical protein
VLQSATGTIESTGILKKIHQLNQSIIKNAGETIVRQVIIPKKNFCNPSTLFFHGDYVPERMIAGIEPGGDASV